MKVLDLLRRLRWPQRLALACALVGGVFWLRLLSVGAANLGTVLLTSGLCLAWVGSTIAALLLGLTALERLRGRPLSVPGTPIVWRALGAVGAGLMLVATSILMTAFNVDIAILGGVGALAVVVALWLRGQPTQSPVRTVALLVVTIGLFQAPREEGQISLRWNSVDHRTSWSTSGGEQCTGMDLGDQPATIAAYRPAFVIEPGLSGALGQLVNDRLGRPAVGAYQPGVAVVSIQGHLGYGDPLCYAPLVKSQTFRGHIMMTVSLRLDGRRGDAPWSLSCTNTRNLDVTIESTSTGIASCRDLADEVAAQLAEQITQEVIAQRPRSLRKRWTTTTTPACRGATCSRGVEYRQWVLSFGGSASGTAPEGGFRGQRTHRANLPARRTATRDPLTDTGAHPP